MNVSGPDRHAIRIAVMRANMEYTDKITDWDGDLRPLFVERLSVLCATSQPFLTPEETDVLCLDSQIFTGRQIEQLTHVTQPDGGSARRLTQHEIGIVVGWSQPTICRVLQSAYEKLARSLPPEIISAEYDAEF